MRLPVSIIAQPPIATESPHLAATYADSTEASDMGWTAAGPEPWWERVSGVVLGGVFNSAVAALIAVTDTIHVGMYHAPWVKSLANHTPTAEQAGDAMSVAMATGTANAAASTSTAALTPTGAAMPPASPDRIVAAHDRMEQRVYSQVQQLHARTVAEREMVEENGVPTPASSRHCYRSTRYTHHSAPFNTAWHKGT